jgi:hypothetical protein
MHNYVVFDGTDWGVESLLAWWHEQYVRDRLNLIEGGGVMLELSTFGKDLKPYPAKPLFTSHDGVKTYVSEGDRLYLENGIVRLWQRA